MIGDFNFYEAIQKKDIIKIRSMIANSFIIDPSTEDAKEMLSILKQYDISIYEEHDGIELKEDENLWTKKYFEQLLGELLYNFSQERIKLLLKVTPYVYQDYLLKEKVSTEIKNNVENNFGHRNKNIADYFIKVIAIFIDKLESISLLNNKIMGDKLICLGNRLIKLGNKLKK